MKKNKISYSKLYINDKELIYQVRFSKKAKYLQLRITSTNQLELIVPKKYSIKEAEKFLHSRIDWIKKYQANLLIKINEFYLFGEKLDVKQHFNLFIKKHHAKLEKNLLIFDSPAESKIKLDELYLFYLKKLGKEYLKTRTIALSNKFGFNVKGIKIRGQKTRWGSCSSKGNLSFNYKLIKYRKEVIDYVIIHELCHLKEMNHSKNFWNLVEKYCPGYKFLRKELRNSL